MWNVAIITSIVLSYNSAFTIEGQRVDSFLQKASQLRHSDGTQLGYFELFLKSYQEHFKLDDHDRELLEKVLAEVQADNANGVIEPPPHRYIDRDLRKHSQRYQALVAETMRPPLTNEQGVTLKEFGREARKEMKNMILEFRRSFHEEQLQKGGFQNLLDQKKVILKRLNDLSELESFSDLNSKYHLALLGRIGPVRLLREPSFKKYSNPLVLANLNIAKVKKTYDERLVQIRRSALQRYFDILTEQQRQMLSRRLNVSTRHLAELYDLVPIENIGPQFTKPLICGPVVSDQGNFRKNTKMVKEILEYITVEKWKTLPEPHKQICSSRLQDYLKHLEEAGLGNPEGIDSASRLVDSIDDQQITALLRPIIQRIRHRVREHAAVRKNCVLWPGLEHLNIRLHVEEYQPQNSSPSIKIKKLFAGGSTTRRITGATFSAFVGFWDPVRGFNKGSLELLPHQKKDVQKIMKQWEYETESNLKLEQIIDTNNRLLKQLADILVDDQGAIVFQSTFVKHGPHSFFQRADVRKEFHIEKPQIRAMTEFSNTIDKSLELELKRAMAETIQQILLQGGGGNEDGLEKLFGIPIADAAKTAANLMNSQQLENSYSNDAEFFLGIRFSPHRADLN